MTLTLGHGASAADIDLGGGTHTISTSQSTTGSVNIGATANTTVTIEAGADLSGDAGVNIAAQATGQATVTIDGGVLVGGPDGDIIIGGLGTAEVTVQNGGTLTTNFASTYVGVSAGGSGTVTVTGAASTWSTGDLVLGDLGQGSATITDDATLTVGGDTVIGNGTGSEGSLTISDGGTADTYEAFIGYGAGSTGTATVTGTDSYWSTHGNIAHVGYDGAGSLTVTDGGEFTTSGDYLYLGSNTGSDGTLTISAGGTVSTGIAFIGNASGSTGAATVTGPGSSWTTSGNAYVGGSGTGSLTVTDDAEFITSGGTLVVGSNSGAIGTLTISDGGTATIDGDTAIGDFAGSTGSATVTGSGSSLDTQNLYVGKTGSGTLTISDGGTASTRYAYIGYDSGSTGSVTITGPNSSWTTNSTDLYVGLYGTGTLLIEDGADVLSDSGSIGYGSISEGTVTVTGSGSTWEIDGSYLDIGVDGAGTLAVADGAVVTTTGYIYVGHYTSSEGTVTVTGDGSQLSTDLNVSVGFRGTGTLTVADGATVTAGSGSRTVAIATLSGSTGTLNIGAAAGATAVAAGMIEAATIEFGSGTGSLVFNHTDDDYQFDAAIVGGGTLEAYSGTSILTGDLTAFTGDTEIHGGTLSFNSTYSGAISVLNGGTLGGNGTLSNVTLSSGATVAPGNSIGTLNIGGDLDFVSGTTYAVEVNDAGSVAGTNNDLLHATGTVTIDSGATVAVSAENGTDNGSTYVSGTTYTILTADTLVSGTFGSVTDDFAFLDGALTYDTNNVYLTLTASADFASAAKNANQKGVANAIQSMGSGTLFDAIAGLPNGAPADAFQQLAGDIHQTVETGFIDQVHLTADVINNRIRDAFDGIGANGGTVAAYGEEGPKLAPADTERFSVWAEAFGGWNDYGGDGNASATTTAGGGFLIGGDALTANGWRFGLAGGYSREAFDSDTASSSGNADSYHIAAYGGTSMGPLGLRFGSSYSWHDVDTRRSVAFSGFADELTADYGASTAHAFTEASWRIDRDLVHIEPFAGLAYVNQHSDAFTEQGGSAALSSSASTLDTVYTSLGLRGDRDIAVNGMLGKLSASAAWRHAFGDTASSSTMAFSSGDSFNVTGVPLATDTALLSLGLAFEVRRNATVSLNYDGEFGGNVKSHGARATFNMKF